MAFSRITNYGFENKMIEYHYEDHETKKRVDVKEHIYEFMQKLIMHIPEAQFKMIRYYGIYATCEHHQKTDVKKLLSAKKTFYRQELIDTFGTDPLLCDCGHYMGHIDYWVTRKRLGVDLNESS